MPSLLHPTLSVLILALLGAPALLAQQRIADETVPERPSMVASTTEACELGTATADLDAGGVRASLYNTGGLFWRGGDPAYEVPRGSGINAMFTASIWLGGTVDGDLRFAGADYANWEWWPGPLDDDGNAPVDCAAFDRIYLVTQQPDGTLTGDVADWPANLGAPFDDLDGDDVYEPGAGEMPTVYGHQTAFWVMNDRGNVHNWSGKEALGLTARVTAFTFNVDDPALGFGTFYRYVFENPNAYTIENARLSFFADPDLGDFNDDYVGSDPERGMGFVYNGDTNDEGAYGIQPPALGIYFLSGAEGMLSYTNDSDTPGNPFDGDDAYSYMNFTWRDGTPVTDTGFGYNPGDPDAEPTTWMWPGEPETLAFWSEFDTDGEGRGNQPANRRFLTVAEPFELGPGATHTVDVALVWGRGVSFLDSVTKIRAHSDQVQESYDAGTLFAPGDAQTGPPDGSAPPLPTPTLATPALTFPEDGTEISDVPDDELAERDDPILGGPCPGSPFEECARVPLRWEAVPGATYYEVQVAHAPTDFDSNVPGELGPAPTFLAPAYADNERDEVYWRVRAMSATEVGVYSEVRSYRTRYRFVPSIAGEGRGIVEVAYGGMATCATDPTRAGCDAYGGATVLHTPSTNDDFYVTSSDGSVNRLLSYRGAITSPFDYELRFTDACATEGCWAVYTIFDGLRDEGLAVRVPFELWKIGDATTDDPSDDVRMIPVLRAGSIGEDGEGNPIPGPYGPDWNYGRYENAWSGGGEIDGGADPNAEVSDQVYWLIPDRPDGYDRFAADAVAAGAGNLISTTDTQIDPNPSSDAGEACRNQGFYIDFCHRNDETEFSTGLESFMAPIGLMQIADEAGDDTLPPPGTVVRFVTTTPEPVNSDDDAPLPNALTLEAYPNPARGAATLAYALPTPGRATLTVYDVLGRRVAVLADEMQAAGTHRATLETTRLASGVYVAVLETDAERQAQRLTVLR